jgi:hypothetical protein
MRVLRHVNQDVELTGSFHQAGEAPFRQKPGDMFLDLE